MVSSNYSATCYLGVDVGGGGRGKDDMEPLNGTMRIDSSGINKNATFEQVVELARTAPGILTKTGTMHPLGSQANIILKTGGGKWYLKKFPIDEIESLFTPQSPRRKEFKLWVVVFN